MTYGMYTASLSIETHVGQHLQGCVACHRFVASVPVDFPATDLAVLFAGAAQ